VVTIDGPAGAGKSTVARRAAKRLGYAFLDTGAMYRAATWRAMHLHISLTDAEAVTASTRDMRLELMDDNIVHVDGVDVSDAIRTREVTQRIHHLADLQGVRDVIVAEQRRIASKRPTVAEGRDMGTVVFPQASCKIFLDASPEQRAHRRAEELKASGQNVDIEELAQEIRDRDDRDRNREVAPLRPADGATEVDTTGMTLEESIDTVIALVEATRETAS
jgi:cytidylate kinase